MAITRTWLPRFSLRALLVGVAVLGVGLAGVLSASEGWSFALAAAFHLLLPSAVVLAIVLTGQSRAFWIGVVVFSVWCNLFFADKAEFIADRISTDVRNVLHEKLSAAIVTLHSARIEREADRIVNEAPPGAAATIAYRRQRVVQSVTYDVQLQATFSARRYLMILLALGGGCLASWAYRFRQDGQLTGSQRQQAPAATAER